MGRGIRIYPTHLVRVKNVIQKGKYIAPRCPSCDGRLIPKIVPPPFTKEIPKSEILVSQLQKTASTTGCHQPSGVLKRVGILNLEHLKLRALFLFG